MIQTFNVLLIINKIKKTLHIKYNFANDKDTSTLMMKTIKKLKIINNLKFIVEKIIKIINSNYYLIFEINV